MKQEFDSPQLEFLHNTTHYIAASFYTENRCLLPISIVASSKRMLGHNIFLNSCFICHFDFIHLNFHSSPESLYYV